MRIDLGFSRHHRDRGVGVRAGNGDRIELVVVVEAPDFGGLYFQRDGVTGELDRRQRDLVLVGEVGDRFHVRITRHQHVRHRLHGDERTRFLRRAGGFVPDGGERRHARPDEVGLPCEQCVEFGRRTGALRPRGLDLAEARHRGVLLDQLLRLDDDHRQIGQAELLRHPHFVDFGLGGAADGHCD